MASRRRLKYQWRLFIPQVAMLWVIIGCMAFYSYSREKEYKLERIEWQLSNVNSSIIGAYEGGNNDITAFVKFIDIYFSNSMYDDAHISVYNNYGRLIAQNGSQYTVDRYPHSPHMGHDDMGKVQIRTTPGHPEEKFFYSSLRSEDGAVCVHTSMPYTSAIEHIVGYNPLVWVLVISLAILVTIISYLSTLHLSRSVYLLRDFAHRAANGEVLPEAIGNMEFPHDELGEVSQQIVNIYRAKDKALARSEHEHQVAQRATEEKARIKRQMTNNLNHELKTPVGIIKGYLDTIISDPDIPPTLRDSFLKKAQTHADRLSDLLKDVSTLTRLDEGSNQVEITDINFHDLAVSIATDLEVSHVSGSLEFSFDIPDDCWVLANTTLVSNALLNLVRNAAAYSKGTRIRLAVIDQTEQDYTFSFADDGIGVAPEHLSHLFERFYRVDEGRARKSGGTGLGLSIVQLTFSSLGGSISVHNATPHGLEFIFTLPKGKNLSNA
ncbi:MAG: HAMP domain-containing histidine kinase [Muribaculaceae bacterium]|nr:HAMP domain-containing histidine kinase [Muribaculaceae bacterium]